jgi:flagellar motor component MotA
MAILFIVIFIGLVALYAQFCNVLVYTIDPNSILFILFLSFFSAVIGFGFKKVFKSIKIAFSNYDNFNKEELLTGANVFKTMFISSLLSGLLCSTIDFIALFVYLEEAKKAIGASMATILSTILYGILFSTAICLPLWLKLKNKADLK